MVSIDDDVIKSNMLRNESFFKSVWIEDDHTFMLMFPSIEFKKLMISDGRPNTCKTIF